VRALEDWLAASGYHRGPLFRAITRYGAIKPSRLCDRAEALIVKRAAQAAGLHARRYNGHSLRARLATSAAEAGVPERAIMGSDRPQEPAHAPQYILRGSLFTEELRRHGWVVGTSGTCAHVMVVRIE